MSPRPRTAAQVKKLLAPSEHQSQVQVFQWAALNETRWPELALLHCVPNFARLTPRWGAYMKAEGKKAGIPDIHLPVSLGPYHSLYIEMKVPGGKPTAEQERWHSLLRSAGNCVAVCHSADEAISILTDYFGLPLVMVQI